MVTCSVQAYCPSCWDGVRNIGQLMARSEQALDIRMAQMHMARRRCDRNEDPARFAEDLFRGGKLDLSLDLRFLHAVPPHFCTVFRTMPS